jgi:thermolabile hemolysin
MRHGKLVQKALLASLLIPAAAIAGPNDDRATLRCVFQSTDKAGVFTVEHRDVPKAIPGSWLHNKIFKWSNLFSTDVTPLDIRDTCTSRAGMRPGQSLLEAKATGANADDPYAYEIWHRGDLRPGAPIERIVAFGDSLTDKGNMHLASQQVLSIVPGWSSLPSTTWFAGRFSNGPTWVEYLAARNRLPLNSWAVGGAQTRDKKLAPIPSLPSIHGIDRQLDRFFEHAKQNPSYDPSRTLFTFLAAGNDFVNDTKTGPEIIAQQEASLKRLADFGARKIIVVNLPDVSVAPVFRLGRTDAHTVLGKVEYYNAHIGDVARRVAASTGAEIRVVDVRSSFDAVLAKKEKYGFSNVTDTCLKIDKDSPTTYLGKQELRAGCVPGEYVFWDTLHPTTRMHELMAGWVVESAPPGWDLK